MGSSVENGVTLVPVGSMVGGDDVVAGTGDT